jgi:phage portal protein BeeE
MNAQLAIPAEYRVVSSGSDSIRIRAATNTDLIQGRSVKTPKTANPLMSPLTRYPMGINDYSFSSDARNGYLATAAIFGITTCYAMHYPQIRMVVKNAKGEPWLDHPLQYVLDHPNKDMSGSDAALYNAVYILLGGASHQYLYRTPNGQVFGYRPHSVQEIRPVPIGGADLSYESWIKNYVFQPLQGGYPQEVDNKNVVTLRFHSINPLQPQLSVSPFTAAFIDANADSQITQFPLDLLKNGQFLSTVFSLAPESKDWDSSEFDQTKAEVQQQYSGVNKFNPVVVRGGNKVESVFADFRKMDVAGLGARPEVRLCVAARADIVYVGFTAGLGTSTYDNVRQARVGFVRHSVLSLATNHAKTLTAVFQRENWANHPFGNGTSDFTIEPDTADVIALQEDMLDNRKQATMEFQAGGTVRNEYRQDIGKEPLPKDDPRGDELSAVTSAVSYPQSGE